MLAINYYSNGAIKEKYRYNLINGRKEGLYEEFYSSGKLQFVCNYVNDLFDGRSIKYYENGEIMFIRDYVNNISVGECIQYYENGNIFYTCNYNEKGISINVNRYKNSGVLNRNK